MQSFRRDCASQDPEIRRRALTVRTFLREWAPELTSLDARSDLDPISASLVRTEWDDAHLTATAGWDAIPRPRPGMEEGEARRRRREAMVLHEGDGRIGEEDIIRPSRP